MAPKPGVGEFERFMPEDRTGFNVYRNKKNRLVVIELDFTADPKKRDQKWIEAERSKVPPKRWAVEYLRSWATFAGRAVYENVFYKHLHVAQKPIVVDPGLPVLRGWDFGGNQSCIMCQLQKGHLVVLDELPNRGTNTLEFAPLVRSHCEATFGPDLLYVDVIDPSAMWEGKTATGVACAKVMRDFGLEPKPARTNDPEARILAVTELLMRPVGDKRCLVINPHCTMTIRGFEGGYHYPERPSQSQRADRPKKNLFSHIQDALQYVALRVVTPKQAEVYDEDLAYERSLYRFSD